MPFPTVSQEKRRLIVSGLRCRLVGRFICSGSALASELAVLSTLLHFLVLGVKLSLLFRCQNGQDLLMDRFHLCSLSLTIGFELCLLVVGQLGAALTGLADGLHLIHLGLIGLVTVKDSLYLRFLVVRKVKVAEHAEHALMTATHTTAKAAAAALAKSAASLEFVLLLRVVLFWSRGRVLGKSSSGKNAESEDEDSNHIKFDLRNHLGTSLICE